MILGHVDVSDGNTETEDLLQLEFDGRPDFVDLLAEVFVVRDWGGEFTSLGKTGTQKTGDLLDQGLGSEESVVLLCELLDELLVLEIVRSDSIKLGKRRRLTLLSFFKSSTVMNGSSSSSCFALRIVSENSEQRGTARLWSCLLNSPVNILGIGENTQGHSWSRNVRELDGTRETLVTLRVVVLESDLELDGLDKVPLFTTGLLVGVQGGLGEKGLDRRSHA